MTQSEWQTSQDVAAMLRVVFPGSGGYARFFDGRRALSRREARLFSCALCRQAWGGVTDPSGRAAVEAAERYALGRATGEELEAALACGLAVGHGVRLSPALCAVPAERVMRSPGVVSGYLTNLVPAPVQADLLRCVAGDPWGPAPVRQAVPDGDARPTDEVYRAQDNDPAFALAEAAHQDRDWGALPVLADALEEGGWPQGDALLSHLRGPGPHALGCWAVRPFLSLPPCPECRGRGKVTDPPGAESLLEEEAADSLTLSGCWVPCPECGGRP